MAKQEQREHEAHAGIGADQGDGVQQPKPTASAAAAVSAVGPGALAAGEASGADIGEGKAPRPLRKKVLKMSPSPSSRVPARDEIDVAERATVVVTSESPDHPIDHAFDGKRGPGGTRWMAEQGGEQTIVVIFDSPENVHGVSLEVEEPLLSREQELWLEISCDGGASFREVRRQGFNFSPPDTTFEREEWAVQEKEVTHLRLGIKPDKSGKPCRAMLTTFALRGETAGK